MMRLCFPISFNYNHILSWFQIVIKVYGNLIFLTISSCYILQWKFSFDLRICLISTYNDSNLRVLIIFVSQFTYSFISLIKNEVSFLLMLTCLDIKFKYCHKWWWWWKFNWVSLKWFIKFAYWSSSKLGKVVEKSHKKLSFLQILKSKLFLKLRCPFLIKLRPATSPLLFSPRISQIN